MAKKIFLIVLMFSGVYLAQAQHATLKIGDDAPEKTYKMENVDNKWLSFTNVKAENGTLVIFSCNTCPFVVAWEDRYPLVAEYASLHKIGMMLVNSNHTTRTGVDSKQAMVEHAKQKAYSWPYLIDDNSQLANAYGAMTTPHVFLFDKNDKLVYMGAIDDNYKSKDKVENFFLKDAMEALSSNKAIALKTTRATGCSIKRSKN